MRVDVLGVGFDNVTMDEAVARGMELVCGAGTHYVVTPNPEIVEVCRENPAARDAVNRADLVRRTASVSSRAQPCWERR